MTINYYQKKRRAKIILIVGLILVFLILAFVSFMRNSSQLQKEASYEEEYLEPERKLSDAKSKTTIAPDERLPTLYRLGISFSFDRTIDSLYRNECYGGVDCPRVSGIDDFDKPAEEGNTISFRGYTLKVFDKRSNETIENAIRRQIIPTLDQSTCKILSYPVSSDGALKAHLLDQDKDNKCESDYKGTSLGRHFFTYPSYPNILLYVSGGSSTKNLFSHKSTWLDTIRISE